MQPINALKSAFQNYVNFSGRASRGDYWWYVLAYIIVGVIFMIVDGVLFGGGSASMDTQNGFNASASGGVLTSLWILANIIPLISCAVRRLHDSDRSGWMYLLVMIPLANLYLLYLFIIKGTAGDNRFGPDSVA